MSPDAPPPLRGMPVAADKAQAPGARDMVAVTVLGENYAVSALEVAELGMLKRVYEYLATGAVKAAMCLVLLALFTRLSLAIALEALLLHKAFTGQIAVTSVGL